MKMRRVVRRRKFFGVLRWFSLLLLIGLGIAYLPLPVGTEASAKSEEIIVVLEPAEATELTEPTDAAVTESTIPVPDTYGLTTLVHISTYQPEPIIPAEAEVEDEPEVIEYLPLYSEADAIALAKMGWGEALVTQSDTEIAAAMWCALNRFDSGDPYYRNCKTIEDIVKQYGAFAGYSAKNPVDEHLLWLAYDVLDRWNAEQHGEDDVGRVLPAEYMFFHGDGKENHFRIKYRHDGHYYDWSLESPYES